MKIAFIGGGNMARALIGGMLQRGFVTDAISVVEVDASSRAQLAEQFGVRTAGEPGADVKQSDVVLLAVKPQVLRAVAQSLAGLLGQQLIITIAAGVRTGDLGTWLGGYRRIVRVMPNTPALVLAGVSALYAGSDVTSEERSRAQSILAAVGATLWVEDEAHMDAVTAVSGSGPAYVFYFMEAMQQAAQELGLPPEVARQLSQETFLGASRLAASSPEEPAILRARVTSKGGTTERALSVMEREAVKSRFIDAVKQAAERSRELGEQLGKSA